MTDENTHVVISSLTDKWLTRRLVKLMDSLRVVDSARIMVNKERKPLLKSQMRFYKRIQLINNNKDRERKFNFYLCLHVFVFVVLD